MGSEPLRLNVEGWVFELQIKDYGAQLAIITDDRPGRTHFVRINRDQVYQLLDYLDHNMPVRQEIIGA